MLPAMQRHSFGGNFSFPAVKASTRQGFCDGFNLGFAVAGGDQGEGKTSTSCTRELGMESMILGYRPDFLQPRMGYTNCTKQALICIYELLKKKSEKSNCTMHCCQPL